MWQRFMRVVRSFVGFFISTMEDPKLILEQTVRDMQDKIPVMNQGLAKARGGIIMIEGEIKQYEREISLLTAKVKACVIGKDASLGGQYAIRLKKTQEALARDKEQLAAAKAGYESLLKMKEKFMREMKAKTDEAMAAIRDAEASKWKSELADTFEQFEVAGTDATYDEMVGKLRQKLAEAEGRLAMAAESVDQKAIAIDEQAEALEGQELFKNFQMEMGITDAGSGAAEDKKEEAKKTIGAKEAQKDQA
ncbi:MAG: PspA/IM30 family protein [Elusimicrobia bacterium]|nr:PspA/IM30 family protein [Elusimicrobiota bacterium]